MCQGFGQTPLLCYIWVACIQFMRLQLQVSVLMVALGQLSSSGVVDKCIWCGRLVAEFVCRKVV